MENQSGQSNWFDQNKSNLDKTKLVFYQESATKVNINYTQRWMQRHHWKRTPRVQEVSVENLYSLP